MAGCAYGLWPAQHDLQPVIRQNCTGHATRFFAVLTATQDS